MTCMQFRSQEAFRVALVRKWSFGTLPCHVHMSQHDCLGALHKFKIREPQQLTHVDHAIYSAVFQSGTFCLGSPVGLMTCLSCQ